MSGRRRTGGTFQTTTRYLADRPILFRFDEPHSHAPAHIVYDPGPAARRARELVLVDDELSTGTTLQNLAAAWKQQCPDLERAVLVSLTDWCPRREEVQAALGLPTDFVSLSRGRFAFVPDPAWQQTLPGVTGRGDDKTAYLAAKSPRYGDLPPAQSAVPGAGGAARRARTGAGQRRVPVPGLRPGPRPRAGRGRRLFQCHDPLTYPAGAGYPQRAGIYR
ncbi:phosphoribosyltransferase domain-containing protein [Deinococcus lacus]|uniref:Phosphoribosyltransferase domain-containing protein n=1 Tax=Deinococcus lacus TaxID=392561 RepID=A0ABW1YEK0_9DEIO